MTRCLSAMRVHLGHTQSFHLQYLLCPLSADTTPWFRHLAHFGVLWYLSALARRKNAAGNTWCCCCCCWCCINCPTSTPRPTPRGNDIFSNFADRAYRQSHVIPKPNKRFLLRTQKITSPQKYYINKIKQQKINDHSKIVWLIVSIYVKKQERNFCVAYINRSICRVPTDMLRGDSQWDTSSCLAIVVGRRLVAVPRPRAPSAELRAHCGPIRCWLRLLTIASIPGAKGMRVYSQSKRERENCADKGGRCAWVYTI